MRVPCCLPIYAWINIHLMQACANRKQINLLSMCSLCL
jgi:hypothetical protein